jgi:hypothetical protein
MEIKTKFDVGDKVWIMNSNKATEAEIYEVRFRQRQKIGAKDIMETETTYGLKNLHLGYIGVFSEGEFYTSKEELINSL